MSTIADTNIMNTVDIMEMFRSMENNNNIANINFDEYKGSSAIINYEKSFQNNKDTDNCNNIINGDDLDLLYYCKPTINPKSLVTTVLNTKSSDTIPSLDINCSGNDNNACCNNSSNISTSSTEYEDNDYYEDGDEQFYENQYNKFNKFNNNDSGNGNNGGGLFGLNYLNGCYNNIARNNSVITNNSTHSTYLNSLESSPIPGSNNNSNNNSGDTFFVSDNNNSNNTIDDYLESPITVSSSTSISNMNNNSSTDIFLLSEFLNNALVNTKNTTTKVATAVINNNDDCSSDSNDAINNVNVGAGLLNNININTPPSINIGSSVAGDIAKPILLSSSASTSINFPLSPVSVSNITKNNDPNRINGNTNNTFQQTGNKIIPATTTTKRRTTKNKMNHTTTRSSTHINSGKSLRSKHLTPPTSPKVAAIVNDTDKSKNNNNMPDAVINSTAPKVILHPKKTRGRKPVEDPDKHYACDYCERKFKRQEHLKRHVRSLHMGEKPYECSTCHKRFSRSDNLTQHTKTHKN